MGNRALLAIVAVLLIGIMTILVVQQDQADYTRTQIEKSKDKQDARPNQRVNNGAHAG